MTKSKMMVTSGNVPTFINGALVPPNTPVAVDPDEIDLDTTVRDENGEPVKNAKGKRDIGLEPMSKAHDRVAAPVAVAAIAPTGPNPGAPQQLPPGAIQTFDGYTSAEGTPLVAEGSEAAVEVEEAAPTRASRAKKSDDALS